MPAEWEKHEGTWLQWPQNRNYSRYELKLENIWLAMVDALHDADIGVLICWDQWFPEAARLTTMKGAEIIFIPTAIGFDPNNESKERPEESHAAWQIVQQGHAAANACYLAAVNRVGLEEAPDGSGQIQFWGSSFVADLSGQVIKKASTQEEENLLCPVDLGLIEQVRIISSYPFRDRRVDSYQDLSKLYSN